MVGVCVEPHNGVKNLRMRPCHSLSLLDYASVLKKATDRSVLRN